MSGLDVVALILILLLLAMVVGVVFFLATWPGRVAEKRGHPYLSAIQIGGWVTLIFGGIFWPLVLMWAHAGGVAPVPQADTQTEPLPVSES